VLSWALLGQPASRVAGMPLIGLAAGAGWRFAWVALPLASSVLALLAVHARTRAAVASTRSERSAQRGSQPGIVALWRRPEVSRWALGELFIYTAWNGTLVYAGTLLIDSYNLPLATAGLILGLSAAAYFPGSLVARRHIDSHARALLISLGLAAALTTAACGAVRPGPAFSAALLALLMALAGARGLAGSALGLQIAPRQRVQITGVRAAGVQFGGLLGAGLGGAALAAGSYPGLGAVLALAFAVGVLPHLVMPTADRPAPSVAA
jgi:predicted MFS family arabinose efflux permease